jgi:hypothetical protein
MKQSGIIALGIISILIVVVAVSDWTDDSKSSKNPSEDIYLTDTTIPLNFGEAWLQNGWIASRSSESYKNVSLVATGYTKNNQIIGEDNIFVSHLDNRFQSTGFVASFPNKGKALDHITIKVLNATPI